MSTQQIAVRLPEEQLALLDELVGRGVFDSRADAVRAGIVAVCETDRQRRIDQEIVDGYQRVPPDAAERKAALRSLRDAIDDEPW